MSMKNRLLTILALSLVFVSVLTLAAAIQFSSDLIGVRSQPQPTFSSDINITGQANRTDTGVTDPDDTNTSASVTGPDLSFSSLADIDQVIRYMGSLPEILNDPPGSLLLWIVILVILLLLAYAGYTLWRRRKHGPQAPPVVEIACLPARAALEYHEGDFKLTFPQIREPLPAVWGAGEPLTLVIQDKAGGDRDITILIEDKVTGQFILEQGVAHVELHLDKGDHRITVGPGGNTDTGRASWADVRIVDYREEVVQLFNEMYRGYRASHASLKDEMTARELEIAMRKDLVEDKQKNLGDTIMLFEYANYSQHAIQRKEFEEMYLSRIGLMPAPGGMNVDGI